MKVCIVDFETNGFNPVTDRATEIGALLVDTKDYSAPPGVGTLLYDKDYPPQPEVIVQVTGITDVMLKEHGRPFPWALSQITAMFEEHGWPDYFLAHNAVFDQGFFQWEMKRYKEMLTGVYDMKTLQRLFDLQWICSIQDISHPEKFKCKKLSHLALDYGMAIDPKTLHRAFDDVVLLANMLAHVDINWNTTAERLKMPWLVVRAMVPKPWEDNGAGKDKAASLGFRWENLGDKKYDKMWVKKIKEVDIKSESEKLGYELTIIRENT
jgi:DNA polymerase III epsilon subunit-like protein